MTSLVIAGPKNYPAYTTTSKKKQAFSSVSLSHCALKYALCISNPFDSQVRNACLPIYPSPPSQKIACFTRFTATVGTAGVGFFSLTPCLASDGILGFYSNSTFAGVTATPVSAQNVLVVGVSSLQPTTSPYTTAELQAGALVGASPVYGRMVSVGVRISYIGTTLNESGLAYLYTDPEHGNVSQIATTQAQLGSLLPTEICSFTRKPCSLVTFPVMESETTYHQYNISKALYPYSNNGTSINGYTFASAGTNCGAPSSQILFTGVAGSQVFIEIIQHMEFAGTLTGPVATPSDSDQAGFDRVQAAAMRLPELRQSNGPGPSNWTLLKQGLMEVAKALKPIAINKLTSMAAALLI